MKSRRCRHCERLYSCRTGRGLCRTCYFDPAIKAQYPLLSTFGGKRHDSNIIAAPVDPADASKTYVRVCAKCRYNRATVGYFCEICLDEMGERLRAELAGETLEDDEDEVAAASSVQGDSR